MWLYRRVSRFGRFETSGTTHTTTQFHISEDLNRQQHLKHRTVLYLVAQHFSWRTSLPSISNISTALYQPDLPPAKTNSAIFQDLQA